MLTYEARVKKIKTVEDIDTQLRLAKAYLMRLKRAAKQPELSLAEKLQALENVKQAEITLRAFRRNCFDIEDEITRQDSLKNEKEAA
ncbi:hypothetical protein [Aliidiomarina quisquiliarum]|uniref:hypothetical protein n=1 Tax=Aliidiomarina quisquiliarum TaxID=2938947 RepID=UPI00208E19B1|nr:hypothetical protein [Aliidiomarina quisquiliarum]MCO4319996.1 hypothetical protein [Aliidiomarina quisquiliarum]